MSRMTIRVSRDSGRTWTRAHTVRGKGKPPVSSSEPPCRCPRCTKERDRDRT